MGAVKARVNTGFASEGQLFSVYSAKQDLGCCGGRAKNYVQPVILDWFLFLVIRLSLL